MRTKSSSLTRRIVELAWPVLIAQLSSMTQMLSDTVLAGRYGTEDLAAVAVASGIYISVVMLMVGILQAVAPTVAHHVGAGRRDEIGPAVQQGFWLALGLALPAMLFWKDRARFYSYLHRVWSKTSDKPVWMEQAEEAACDFY